MERSAIGVLCCVVVAFALLLTVAGCDDPACIEGASSPCVCTDGSDGAQVCGATGAYGACECIGGDGDADVDGDSDSDVDEPDGDGDSDSDVDSDHEEDADAEIDQEGDGDADADGDADVDADADRDTVSDSDADEGSYGDSDGDSESDSDSDTAVDAEGDGDTDTEGAPCSGVTCSGHGRCFDDGETAICVCDVGYYAESLDCVTEITPCDGGVFDTISGLCWEDPSFDGDLDWDSAVEYCDALDLGGHGPGSWRLPTISELRSLIRGCSSTETGGWCGVADSCLCYEVGGCYEAITCIGCEASGGGGIDGAYWPPEFRGPVAWAFHRNGYWSSSFCAGRPSSVWTVEFQNAGVYQSLKTTISFVRCVRREP
jgi:hypothetical protein